ncbi:hypothetical protein CASFOL_039823 [Castilleja foliolosa]|uniref:Stomatin-like protein n=1 Tax=Castilleja foliolosa TaxID=1961234 RepID=A0ABD3BG96_9LAMI
MSAFKSMESSMSRHIERDTLNEKIVIAINDAAKDWGLKCLRYEISEMKAAMAIQAEAERKKRAQVLESKGEA